MGWRIDVKSSNSFKLDSWLTMWPDLCTIMQLWQNFKNLWSLLRIYLELGKSFNLLWQIFILVHEQIFNNKNLTIWLRCGFWKSWIQKARKYTSCQLNKNRSFFTFNPKNFWKLKRIMKNENEATYQTGSSPLWPLRCLNMI